MMPSQTSKVRMAAMLMATLLSTPPVGHLHEVTPATWSSANLPSNVRLRTGSTRKVNKTKQRAKAKAARRARRVQR